MLESVMFYALAVGKIDTEGLTYVHELQDIESLNQRAMGGELEVGRVGLGAMRLTGDQLWGPYPDHAAAVSFLQEAVQAGVTLIDTADVYGPHTNEQLIHDALHPYPAALVIATKGGFVRGSR